MLYKYGERTRSFLGRFLIKQIFHSLMLDMRWLQPTHNPQLARGIIVYYLMGSLWLG